MSLLSHNVEMLCPDLEHFLQNFRKSGFLKNLDHLSTCDVLR